MHRNVTVYLHEIRVGNLVQTDDGFEFSYLPDYIGHAISLSLPVDTRHHFSPTLHPFFKGLAPEGWLKKRYSEIQKFLLKNVDSTLIAKYDILQRVVCAYLLGNNDMHLRNLGVVYAANGDLSIAPVYDFVSVVPYPSSFSEVLALPLLEKEESDYGIADGLDSHIGEYTGHDFLEFAKGMGLNRNLAAKRIQLITGKVEKLIEIINESYMIDKDKRSVCEYISRRATLLNTFDIVDA